MEMVAERLTAPILLREIQVQFSLAELIGLLQRVGNPLLCLPAIGKAVHHHLEVP